MKEDNNKDVKRRREKKKEREREREWETSKEDLKLEGEWQCKELINILKKSKRCYKNEMPPIEYRRKIEKSKRKINIIERNRRKRCQHKGTQKTSRSKECRKFIRGVSFERINEKENLCRIILRPLLPRCTNQS